MQYVYGFNSSFTITSLLGLPINVKRHSEGLQFET